MLWNEWTPETHSALLVSLKASCVAHSARFRQPKTFSESETLRSSVKKFLCLAFLSVEDVDAGLIKLREENSHENFQKLTDYFGDTYVGTWRGSRRIRPKFEADEKNLYAMVLELHTDIGIDTQIELANYFLQFLVLNFLVKFRFIL